MTDLNRTISESESNIEDIARCVVCRRGRYIKWQEPTSPLQRDVHYPSLLSQFRPRIYICNICGHMRFFATRHRPEVDDY